MFSQIYKPRYINNIYLDSILLDHYRDSVEGATTRTKFRIRWYGDLFGQILNPSLEIKQKNSFLTNKQTFPVDNFILDRSFTDKTLKRTLHESSLPAEIKTAVFSLEPVVLNRYRRAYWLSANRKYRLTMDSEMVFHSINKTRNTFRHVCANRVNTVVEVKYSEEDDEQLEAITNYFPFRLSRNSKYVNGIQALYEL